jgi:hypothetical protein
MVDPDMTVNNAGSANIREDEKLKPTGCSEDVLIDKLC